MKQKLPLPALAAGMSHLERGAWREADEVQLVVHEARPVIAGRELGRQHGETGRQRKRALAGPPDLELRQVGAGDTGVAADVDDADSMYVFPKVIDRPRDDAARDQGLPQADLVSDEEAGRAVCLQEQAPECVVDSEFPSWSFSRHCHVWTPPVLQGENRFETAVELAVMYPAFSLRYTDRWP